MCSFSVWQGWQDLFQVAENSFSASQPTTRSHPQRFGSSLRKVGSCDANRKKAFMLFNPATRDPSSTRFGRGGRICFRLAENSFSASQPTTPHHPQRFGSSLRKVGSCDANRKKAFMLFNPATRDSSSTRFGRGGRI